MHPKVYDRILKESEEKKIQKQCEANVESIENALLNFIVKERLALSKLESISLRKLIQGILAKNLIYC